MRVLLLGFLLSAASLTCACSGNARAGAPPSKAGGADAVPVRVATASEREMPVDVHVVGAVEPCATVAVRALVGGELTSVHFQEGQEVKKGDLLFRIDPRPFEAQLHQAEATLAKDTAQAQNAGAQAARYRELIGRGIATREQVDQASTNAAALQAAVKADTAAVETATLQLQYATIRAPISGRTGALMIQAGNLVRTSDTTPLVVINQLAPIYVTFAIPEATLPDIRRFAGRGTLRVEVQTPGAGGFTERGRISFIDNTVDRATGTIKVKGLFENTERRLWPGLFVNVVVTLTTEPRALVVPAAAVQEGPEGQYVYVVRADRTVESRSVTVGRTIGNDAVIASGLAAGDTVVTDGHLRLVSGRRVTVDRPAAPAGRR